MVPINPCSSECAEAGASQRAVRGATVLIAAAALLAAALVFAEGPAAGGGSWDDRQPIPVAELLKVAAAQVKEVFKTDYAKTRPEDKLALALTLLQLGVETQNDPAAKYILYREARTLAVAAGDSDTALNAQYEIGKFFRIDDSAETAELLSYLVAFDLPPEARRRVGEEYSRIIEAAVTADQSQFALEMISKAGPWADRVGEEELVAQLKAWSQKAQALQRDAPAFKAAMATLQRDPTDAEARTIAGRFLCFVKDDWDSGLPLLAECSDQALKTAAQGEMAAPSEPADLLWVADLWWDAVEKQPAALKAPCQQRAISWYAKALPSLEGLARVRAEQRVAGIVPAETPRVKRTGWIDLLALVDTAKHVERGVWDIDRGRLHTTGVGDAKLVLPARPHGSYELSAVFTRVKGTDCVVIFLPVKETAVSLFLCGWWQCISGFSLIEEKEAPQNATRNTNVKIENGKLYTLTVRVLIRGEEAELSSTLNGQSVAKWRGKVRDLSPFQRWHLNDDSALGLGTICEVFYHSIKLRMLSGDVEMTP